MNRVPFLLLVFLTLTQVGVASEPIAPDRKLDLFNGHDLTGWTGTLKEPGPDPFSVRGGVLQVAGMPFGYLRTEKAYTHYRLHLEWRWLDSPPAPDQKRNSGVLLHITGEDTVWPNCIEGQLRADNAGFFVFLGNATSSELQQLQEQANAEKDSASPPKKGSVRVIKRNPDVAEHPVGEWNAYDIVCAGDTITLTVNGTLANQATGCLPHSGTIGLQSEGAPMEFRNIYLEPAK